MDPARAGHSPGHRRRASRRCSGTAPVGARPPERTRQRPTDHPYALRGLLKCGICGSTMQCSFRKSRADGPGRVLYRCEIRRSRALPPELVEHPATVYVRQDAIVDKVDQWISSLASAEVLARASCPDRRRPTTGRPWSPADRHPAQDPSLIAAIESGSIRRCSGSS